jgi:hypothetical protein
MVCMWEEHTASMFCIVLKSWIRMIIIRSVCQHAYISCFETWTERKVPLGINNVFSNNRFPRSLKSKLVNCKMAFPQDGCSSRRQAVMFVTNTRWKADEALELSTCSRAKYCDSHWDRTS